MNQVTVWTEGLNSGAFNHQTSLNRNKLNPNTFFIYSSRTSSIVNVKTTQSINDGPNLRNEGILFWSVNCKNIVVYDSIEWPTVKGWGSLIDLKLVLSM